MNDLIVTARELCAVESVAGEREIIARLQKKLATTEDVSLEVMATLHSGEKVDLTTISDAGDVDEVTLTIAIGSKEEVIGPCKPKDPNSYFDLFLE